MGELDKILMPYVTRVGELPTWLKVAWLLWLAWGAAQLEWRRRARSEPEWQPRLSIRAAIDPDPVPVEPEPVATVAFDMTVQPEELEPIVMDPTMPEPVMAESAMEESAMPEPVVPEPMEPTEPAMTPKRRKRPRTSRRGHGAIPTHLPVVAQLSAE
jgi:hypothetical protein